MRRSGHIALINAKREMTWRAHGTHLRLASLLPAGPVLLMGSVARRSAPELQACARSLEGGRMTTRTHSKAEDGGYVLVGAAANCRTSSAASPVDQDSVMGDPPTSRRTPPAWSEPARCCGI